MNSGRSLYTYVDQISEIDLLYVPKFQLNDAKNKFWQSNNLHLFFGCFVFFDHEDEFLEFHPLSTIHLFQKFQIPRKRKSVLFVYLHLLINLRWKVTTSSRSFVRSFLLLLLDRFTIESWRTSYYISLYLIVGIPSLFHSFSNAIVSIFSVDWLYLESIMDFFFLKHTH